MIQTIGLSEDLSNHLVDLVLKSAQKSPFETAQMQIILPTRRACLTVKQAFLKQAKNQSLLLPKLMPLYELDNLANDIPPALPKLERTLLLSKLCLAKPTVITAEQALKMAISLGNLLDEFYQFETDITHLPTLVQNPAFAEHWNETIVFLDILTQAWPKILQERHMIDEVDRQIRLINDYTTHLETTDTPIIAAGLDGGLPAVRRLLKTIHGLKNGLILMEGLDTTLKSDDFDTLPPYHYQSGFSQILKALEVSPQKITQPKALTPREVFIKEALKPEDKTDEWRHSQLSTKALESVKRIDCDTVAEEALSIALSLREALEQPDQTACLVTPDRDLARRVILEMKRWGIILDDSAGIPLPKTEVGIFLGLIAQTALKQGKASDTLALLKHPLSADGQNPIAFRGLVRLWEKQARQDDKIFHPDLQTDFQPFFTLFQDSILQPFSKILTAHIRLAEELATSHDRSGAERLWQSEAGQETLRFLSYLIEQADFIGDIEPAAYPTVLDILMNTVTVRPHYGVHPRLDILGPIEARFHHYDLCIIGGLNEGVFPGIPDVGPWLNRPMRQLLKLPQPESKLATLSLDFAHCFCSPKVILTRSRKAEGAETIPSRFLSRLEAVLSGSRLSLPILSATWAKAMDYPDHIDPPVRPAPCPPVSARPTSLSVTKIELWMRNPYAIYARYILKLFPLNPLENPQKQQQYGMAVHRTLDQFITTVSRGTKEDMIKLLDQNLSLVGLSSADKIFYLNRFEPAANFIIEKQAELKNELKKSLTEQTGKITLDVDGKPFTLSGTADRIDILRDETVRILDYKTGQAPSLKEVMAGYAPQLPLEALILKQGGFPNIPASSIGQLAYWKIASKTEDCKEILLTGKVPADTLIQTSLDGLKNLIHTFYQPETKYEACPIAGMEPTYNDYEHLSRFAEWSYGGDE